MLMLWWLTGAALLAAAAALWVARGTARRLDLLTQSYWELRYEFTRLRGAVGGSALPDAAGEGPVRVAPLAAPAPPQTSFVSLSSLKDTAGKAGKAGEAGNAGNAGE